MPLARDTLLFGIALILFGSWMQLYGLDATPIPHVGIVLAALGFLGSVVSRAASGSTSTNTHTVTEE
ncbi:hypothetical protein [Haloprofundus marisrubri]|uniref:hypothetical protein n=1 Tax=Haloprofundus marisrubri TaxID=1514971 RepID=UPI0012BA6D9A|nr:hypothetical protein [Haloprofundus marisrubri]